MKRIAVAVICALCVGCGSKELTRPKAAEIIKTVRFSKKTIDETQQVARIREQTNGVVTDSEVPQLRAFERAGLIKLLVRRCYLFTCAVDVSLTEKGAVQSKDWRKENGTWVVPTARREFLAVTGITTSQPSIAGATYTSQWKPTETGKQLGIKAPRPEAESAMFQLFDDGWRIIQ